MDDATIVEPEPQPSEPRPKAQSIVNRRTLAQGAIGAVAAAGAAGLTAWSAVRHAEYGHRPPADLSRRIVAPRVADAVPRDPAAAAWRSAPALTVPLMQQYMVAPRLEPEGMIPSLVLRTLHNGREIGFLVSWSDTSRSDLEVMARFRDSVAVQLPVDPDGPVGVVMGQPGRPVHLLHWRASWQRNVANGARAVRDAFPNVVNDVAPEDVLKPDQARAFYPALMVGNALAARQHTSPVEELVAEGYGTITSQAQQRAEGRGVFTNGRWDVAIVVPMAGGENQANLHPGDTSRVALAVWEGAKGDRGARKQWADWIALELER
jgi:hypothetical protein